MKQENILKVLTGTPKIKQFHVKNQYLLIYPDATIFQSYDSTIAIKSKGKVYIGQNWDYSKTTGKYRNLFLGETKAETLQKIKSGEYIMLD